MIFTQEHATKLQSSIKAEIVQVKLSTLGGVERASLMILVSLDARETWANGILENSRYACFSITSDSKIELFSGGHKLAKFRKTKVKSIEDAAAKIQRWIDTSLNLEE